MLNNIKKMIPNKYKVYINKLREPIKYIKYKINKKGYIKLCEELNLHFYTDVETVNEIIEKKKSLARYGDGEILWILGRNYESYQDGSEELSVSLQNVLKSDNNNLLIGVPSLYNYNNLSSYRLYSREHWVNFLTQNTSQTIKELLDKKRIYADTQISRCYIDYKDKNFTKERYSNLKRIWNNQEIVIVEGNKTRLGVGNDLFSNAKNIERIICPAKNAFNKYSEILKAVKENCKNKITILALGPTATILASDICNLNENNKKIEYQAIDLGHIDIEYEWFIRGTKKRIPIEGKFVNEARTRDMSEQSLDKEIEKKYNKQIIATIVD